MIMGIKNTFWGKLKQYRTAINLMYTNLHLWDAELSIEDASNLAAKEAVLLGAQHLAK